MRIQDRLLAASGDGCGGCAQSETAPPMTAPPPCKTRHQLLLQLSSAISRPLAGMAVHDRYVDSRESPLVSRAAGCCPRGLVEGQSLTSHGVAWSCCGEGDCCCCCQLGADWSGARRRCSRMAVTSRPAGLSSRLSPPACEATQRLRLGDYAEAAKSVQREAK